MNDALSLADVPRTFVVKDRIYKVAPFTVADVGKLQDWIDQQFPDPFVIAQKEIDRRDAGGAPYSVAQQQFLLGAAMKEAKQGRYLLGTEEANAKAMSNEGIKEIAYLSISKADPTFTREDAGELFGQMGMVDMFRLLDLTSVNRIIGDPKGETPGEAETTIPNNPA